MAYKGRSILIKKGGVRVGGIRTKSLTMTHDMADASCDDDDPWRQLMGDVGARRLSLAGAGIFIGDTVIKEFRDASFSGVVLDLTIEFMSGDTIAGSFLVTSFVMAGVHNDVVTYDVAMEGTYNVVPPSLTR